MKKTWPKAVTAAVVGFAAIVALGACTPDKGSVSTPSASLVQGGASAAVETVTVTKDGVNAIPELNGQVSILSDFQQSTCEGGPGKVTAAGTVVNRGDKPRDIVITASWKKPSELKPVAQASAVLKQVPAGETRAVSITSNVPETTDPKTKKKDVYLCGLRADAGTLK